MKFESFMAVIIVHGIPEPESLPLLPKLSLPDKLSMDSATCSEDRCVHKMFLFPYSGGMNFCLSRQLSCQFYVTFLPYLRWLVYRGGLDLIIEQVISNCGGKSDTQTVLHARWFLLSIFIPPVLDSFG